MGPEFEVATDAAVTTNEGDSADGELSEDEYCSEFSVSGDDEEDAEKLDVTEGSDTSDRIPDVTAEDLTPSGDPNTSELGQDSSDKDRDLFVLESG